MSIPSIRAVIWDIGGVLIRTVDQEPRLRLTQRLGLTREELVYIIFESEKGQQAQNGTITARQLWVYVGEVLHLPAEEIPALEQEFFAGDRVDVELVDYIRSLKPRYKTGIISNAWDDVRRMLHHPWKIADAFDHILLSAEIKLVKPDPRIFQASLQALAVQPGEAVFIDDYLPNVEAARRLGMHAIQFLNPQGARRDLEQLLNEK